MGVATVLRSLKKTKREFLSSVMKRTKVVVTIQSVLPTLQVIIGKFTWQQTILIAVLKTVRSYRATPVPLRKITQKIILKTIPRVIPRTRIKENPPTQRIRKLRMTLWKMRLYLILHIQMIVMIKIGVKRKRRKITMAKEAKRKNEKKHKLSINYEEDLENIPVQKSFFLCGF